jgi:hypothetical protein
MYTGSGVPYVAIIGGPMAALCCSLVVIFIVKKQGEHK